MSLIHINFHAKNVCITNSSNISIFGSKGAKFAPVDSQLDFWRENQKKKHYMKKRMTKMDYDH